MVLATRRLALAAVFLLGLSFFPGTTRADSPAGVYVGQIEGQRIELRLEADGSASLMGQHGTWRSSKGGIVLSSEGESVHAQLSNGAIAFVVEGVRFSLQKQAKSRDARPVRSVAGKAFVPKRLLKGKRFKVSGVNASFVVPKGWKAAYGEHEGQSGIALSSVKFPGVLFIVTANMLSGEDASASVPTLLQSAAREVLGNTPVQVISGPEQFRIDGKNAGQLVLEGSDGAQTLRGRFGGIKVGTWGVGFVAFYDAKLDAQLAPVFETVLATFRGKAPKANRALTSKIVGCWEGYFGETSGTGSSSTSSTYRFDGQGRYSYRYFMSASIPGGSGVSDQSSAEGTFAVYGSELFLESDKGDSSSYAIRLVRGRLFLGGNRFIPCS